MPHKNYRTSCRGLCRGTCLHFILLPDSDYNVDTYGNVRKRGPVLLMCSLCKVGEKLKSVPPLGLFFMSRETLGFCLIRRHDCPRKSESHDAASSPQSTVSTLGEGGGLGCGHPKGNLHLDAFYLEWHLIQESLDEQVFLELVTFNCGDFYHHPHIVFFYLIVNNRKNSNETESRRSYVTIHCRKAQSRRVWYEWQTGQQICLPVSSSCCLCMF